MCAGAHTAELQPLIRFIAKHFRLSLTGRRIAMPCMCFVVPRDVLTRLAQDRELSAELRKCMFATAQISHEIRELRSQAARLTSVAMAHAGALVELAPAPPVTGSECN